MRILTWNVNRRVTALAEQAHALAGRELDVVCLQEATRASACGPSAGRRGARPSSASSQASPS